MKPPAAFKATIHGLKTIPTRKVVQLTVEFPIEELARVAAIAEHGAWVGIARLEEPSPQPEKETKTAPRRVDFAPPAEAAPDKSPRPWSALSYATQAAIRCDDTLFAAYLREVVRTPNEPAAYVRNYCRVTSRSAIVPGSIAAERWQHLDREFSAWKAAERVGAI